MSTEVRHGPTPRFKVKLQAGGRASYASTITGYYTQVDGVTAAGVSHVRWQSARPAKRQAELLGMRSAFVGWFLETYLEHGGTWHDAVAALREYPYAKVRWALLKHRKRIVRRWGKRPSRAEQRQWQLREGRETPVNRKKRR